MPEPNPIVFPMLTDKLLAHKKTLAGGLGLLSVAALPPFYIFPILFITLSALLLLINSASTAKKAFGYAYWFGFTYFACNLSWIGNALLIDAVRLGWLYPLTLLAAGSFFALFIAFPALMSFYFKNFYARYLAFSTLWVMFEWLRSFIFTGFPWNLLGSVLAFSDITIQPAALIGTYGLSLLVLLLTSAPALPIYYRSRRSLLISILIMITISLFVVTYGYWHFNPYTEPQKGITVRLVQPNIPQNMKWNRETLNQNFEHYLKLSQTSDLDKIDFVIWGETATPFPLDFEPQYLKQITSAVPSNGYLITGLVRYELAEGDYRPVNSMFVIDNQGQISGFYDKSHLVPFGEYIPFRRFLPPWITPLTNTIADFLPGTGHKVIRLKDYPAFGTLICYEVIFPAQVLDKKSKPDWLINLTNDGWYGNSQGPYQHLVTARLRAVEEGRTLVRVANTGISAVISPYGQVIASIPLNQEGILDVSLPEPLYVDTLYGRYGNFIPIILCLFNIILCFVILLPFP